MEIRCDRARDAILRAIFAALIVLIALIVPKNAEAQLGLNCTINTTPVAFGDYNVLSATGSEVLNYNLYREATYQTIWGDGTGGTQTYTALAALLTPVTVTVYGSAPAVQNVAVGAYGDSVVATIIF